MKYTPTARYGLAIHTSRPPRSRVRSMAYLAAWVGLMSFSVYMLLAGFTGISGCAGIAHAQPAPASVDRQYDPRAAAKKQEALAVYVRAAWCMQDASRAALVNGFRRNVDAENFAIKMCGGQLRALLMNTPPQWAAADVDALLRGMAVKAVARERGEGSL